MKTQNLLRIGMLPLLALVIFACQKGLKAPSLTSEAKGDKITNQGGPSEDWYVTIDPTKNECDEQVFFLASFNQNDGATDGLIEFKIDGIVVASGTGSMTVTTHLSPGVHDLYASVSTGVNFRGSSAPQSIEVESCVCMPSLSGEITNAEKLSESDGKITYKLTLAITIADCDNGFVGKLQGGLVNGAIVDDNASTPGLDHPTQSNAAVTRWQAATAGTYNVVYTVTKAAGSQDVSGDWKFSYDGGELTFSKVYFDFQ